MSIACSFLSVANLFVITKCSSAQTLSSKAIKRDAVQALAGPAKRVKTFIRSMHNMGLLPVVTAASTSKPATPLPQLSASIGSNTRSFTKDSKINSAIQPDVTDMTGLECHESSGSLGGSQAPAAPLRIQKSSRQVSISALFLGCMKLQMHIDCSCQQVQQVMCTSNLWPSENWSYGHVSCACHAAGAGTACSACQ